MSGKLLSAFFLFNFCFLYGELNAQRIDSATISLPNLTTTQMYEDFDYFVETVKHFSPQTAVRKAVTGIDAFEELQKIRKKINASKNAKAFNELMLNAITVLQDGHSSFLWPASYDDPYLKELGVSDEAISCFPAYYEQWRSINADKKFNLKLVYLDGAYYSVMPFQYKGKKYEPGLKLRTINGINAANFVEQLYPYLRRMRWDYNNKRYFSESFYLAYNLSADEELSLEFVDADGNTIQDKFSLSQSLNYKSNDQQGAKEKKVEYFDDEAMLYIRVPKMNLDYLDYFPTEIKSKASGENVKKVVIDIRGNRGGADNVWVAILESIIKDPIAYEMLLLATSSEKMKAKYPEDSPNWESYFATFLNDLEFSVFASGSRTIEPSENSLNFGDQIYLLVDKKVYSSAGALMAIGLLAENIIVVGENTGKLLGRGINPLVFELPNSKILYRLEPVIDFQNVKNAKDVYHDDVELKVELTIEQYLKRMSYEGDLYSKTFLFTHDPVFQSVIQH